MVPKIPREELVAELHRVADELGDPPTQNEMLTHGEYSSTTYENRFGTWTAAVEAAGLTPRGRQDIPHDELLSELSRLENEIGRCPTVDDIVEVSRYSQTAFLNEFGSIQRARDAAGIKKDESFNQRFSDEELLAEVRRLADGDTAPTKIEVQEKSPFSGTTYENRFGTWSEVCAAAGLRPQVVFQYTDDELISELERIRDQLGHTPTIQEMNASDGPTAACYRAHFGSWVAAFEHVVFDPVIETILLGGEEGFHPKSKREKYGPRWDEIREEAIQQDDEQCQSCALGRTRHRELFGFDIHVHHETPRHEFDSHEQANRMSNLVTLCVECHAQAESEYRRRNAAGQYLEESKA